MELDDWLRHVLPKKRPEDRMKIFREWLRQDLAKVLKRQPTDWELEEKIKLFRERKYAGSDYDYHLAYSLRDYLPVFHKENRIKKAQCAAAARWSKENRKKRTEK